MTTPNPPRLHFRDLPKPRTRPPVRWYSQLDSAIFPDQSFVNVSGEEIPAFAIMHVTKQTLGLIECDKPDTDLYENGPPLLLANGPNVVADGDPGYSQNDWPAVVAYTGAAPSINDPYGPKDGVWTATADYMGMRVTGIVDTTAKLVMVANTPVTKVVGTHTVDLLDDGEVTLTIEVGPRASETTTGFEIETHVRLLETTEQLESTDNLLYADFLYGLWHVTGSLLCPDTTP